MTFTHGNTVHLITTGREKFQLMLADIRTARRSVNLEYFNFRNDSIGNALFDILAARSAQGVQVNAMFDSFGNSSNDSPLRNSHIRHIRATGIDLREFDPIRFPWVNHAFHRDHRKIVTIDNRICYAGGMNVADYYIHGRKDYGQWRDMHMRLTGPVVAHYDSVFRRMWNESFHQQLYPLPPVPPRDYHESQPLPAAFSLPAAPSAALSLDAVSPAASSLTAAPTAALSSDAAPPAADSVAYAAVLQQPPLPSPLSLPSSPSILPAAPFSPPSSPSPSPSPSPSSSSLSSSPLPPPTTTAATIGIVDRRPGRDSKLMRKAYVAAIDAAQHHIQIVNPYPTNIRSVRRALRRALKRGVRLELMVSAKSDVPITPDIVAREMKNLAKRGAHIFYNNDGFFHSKTMAIDGRFCTIGSANLDARSFLYDYEVNSFIIDTATTARLEQIFEQDKYSCTEFRQQDFRTRFNFGHRLQGWFFSLFRGFF